MTPIRRRRLGTKSFSPQAIPGLVLWLKAEAIPAQADGTGIAAWPDSSGNGVTVSQGTGVNQPLYKVNILNGYPAVRGVTASNLGFSSNLADASTSHSFFVVCNPNTTSGFLLDAATGRLIISPSQGSVANKIAYFDGAWHDITSSLQNQWQVASWVLSAATSLGAVYRQGVLLGTAAYTAKAIGGAVGFMAQNTGNTTTFGGDVIEFLAYNSALSDPARRSVEQYLLHKYGLG